MPKSKRPKRAPTGNSAKHYSYREAWGRIAAARGHGFYLEAVTLVESIITDRLISYLVKTEAIRRETELHKYPTLSGLIKKWRSYHPEPITTRHVTELQTRIDAWRATRNHVVHGMVKSHPGEPTDDVEDFLLAAKNAAAEGVLLATALSDWYDKCKRAMVRAKRFPDGGKDCVLPKNRVAIKLVFSNMPTKELLARLATWAQSRWPGHTGPRAPSIEENLICPLTAEAREEFRGGSGGELGHGAKPGKMQSLRSSSALCYNVFQPWREHGTKRLAAALGSPLTFEGLRFERQFRHGLSRTAPNLDVVFDGETPRPLGLECKFLEPYDSKSARSPMEAKYFPPGRARWTEVGLPRLQELAASLEKSISFRHLDAAQLLKHLLGLAHTTKQPPRLRYVWYDTGCEEALKHRRELRLFEDHVDPSVDFAAVTYQDLVRSLASLDEPIPRYRQYLAERYGLGI